MPSLCNRRTALLMLGSGTGAAVLSACAPRVTGAPPSASPSSSSSSSASSSSVPSSSSSSSSASSSPSPSIDTSGNYQGEINFESVLEYEKPGDFEPATREHAQKNTPKPKKPAGVYEKSVKGLRDTIAYVAATVEYALNTGDYSLVQNSPMDESEKEHYLDAEMKTLLDKVRDGKRWIDNGKIKYTLDESQPGWDGKYFSWKRTFVANYGRFEVEDGEITELDPGSNRDVQREFKGHLLAYYENGAWAVAGIANQFEDDADPSNPANSEAA